MHSSYAVNNYAEVFESIVTASKPKVAVELGVLEGYSAIAIGHGLQRNFERLGLPGRLDAYDLFEEYPYRHTTLEQAWANIRAAGVDRWVSLQQAEAYMVH